MVWVPPECSAWVLVLSGRRIFVQDTQIIMRQFERTLMWNDMALGIPWPLEEVEGFRC